MRQLGLLVAVTITACFSDVLVGPAPNLEPILGVHAEVVLDDKRYVAVAATFRRGTDNRGNPLQFTDSSIIVNGSPLQPTNAGAAVLQWRWETATPIGTTDTIAFRGPVVAGFSSSGAAINFVIPARVDPYVLDVSQGDDVQLNVSTVTSASTATGQTEFWRLDIQDAKRGNSRLSVDGRGVTPPAFLIPASLLNAQTGDSLVVNYFLVTSPEISASPYDAVAFQSLRMVWHLRIVSR
jgi:hypothetical protein